MKTLAIDYGTKRVGIAVSYASLAEPLVILDNDANLFKNILQLIQNHHVQQIVIGLSENEMAEKTRRFALLLQEKTTLPIFFNDETLSSYQVHEFLKLHCLKERQSHIDHLAAAVILQNFLDQN